MTDSTIGLMDGATKTNAGRFKRETFVKFLRRRFRQIFSPLLVLFPFASVYIFTSQCLSSFSVCMSVCMSVCLYVCLYVCMPACLSVCLYVCLHVHAFSISPFSISPFLAHYL